MTVLAFLCLISTNGLVLIAAVISDGTEAKFTNLPQEGVPRKDTCIPEGVIAVNITYNNTSETQHKQVYHFEETLNLTTSSGIRINCSDSRAEVTILDPKSPFRIVLLFASKGDFPAGSMYLDDILVFGDNDGVLESSISKRGKETSGAKSPVLLFESRVNKTGTCPQDGKTAYASNQAHASFVFYHVRLHPFHDPHSQNADYDVSCYKEYKPANINEHSEYLVPVILAISFIVVLSLLVSGFLVYRKIEGMGYTSMD